MSSDTRKMWGSAFRWGWISQLPTHWMKDKSSWSFGPPGTVPGTEPASQLRLAQSPGARGSEEPVLGLEACRHSPESCCSSEGLHVFI